MSLIPSESYSFPDHFSSTVTPSRKSRKVEPEPEPIETPPRKPSIVALPNPKPQLKRQPQPEPELIMVEEISEPVGETPPAPAAPNPALRRASAPPPRIADPVVRKIALPPSLKPKVRWNNRAPAMDPAPNTNTNNGNGAAHVPQEPPMPPAQNVIQMKPAPPRPPRLMPRPENLVPQKPLPVPPPAAKPAPTPKPAQQVPPLPVRANPRPVAAARVEAPVRQNARPAVPSTPQADFFEMFAESGETALGKRRRKAKMRRFIVCESIAVGTLLPLAILGLTHHFTNAPLGWAMNILTITAAVAAAIIPILFFAFTPTLPEIER